ncbi:hypothetical protein [Candidatus Tisiphia endosymbiont of Hybos culiciformis]|uniref:hypothetical protein n=1 Tax=Candidatus Tisiphia endosymbiont of Hybos culiciformis TaxID=3139331 RepID=UPI003CCB131B
MSKNKMNNLEFDLINNSLFDSFTIGFFNTVSKNLAFSNHLAKATDHVPPEYDEQVKKILCVLHKMKLRKIGDELEHKKHIISILSNELLPLKDLPLLYLKVIKEAATDDRDDILSKCQNSSELFQIQDLLFPNINNAVVNTDSIIITQSGFIGGEDTVVSTGEGSDSLCHETFV